jgi:cysteine desulfurase
MNHIYLDYAAATPLDEQVLQAMRPYFSEHFYNPSSSYLASRSVRSSVEESRARIAKCLGARPSEVIFTAGGTEANNLAIHGVMRRHPDANVVISRIEHDSVRMPAQQYDRREVDVLEDGLVNLEMLQKSIDEKTALVSIIYANNEIGTVQSLRKIKTIVESIRVERKQRGNMLPLYFHTDACQATNYLDIHAAGLGVDLMTVNAGKIYGPKQCGLLYVRVGTTLHPQILGGGQEFGLRSGTENPAAIVGFAKALDMAQFARTDESARLKQLQSQFIQGLRRQLPHVVINGSLKYRLPNNVHVTVPDWDNERLVMELDERGIQCAVGSACGASSEKPSHVLQAIGMDDAAAQASLRFTMGRDTTEDDIQHVITVLSSIIQSHTP